MTDLIFNDPAEAAAWDMYVAGYASGAGIPFSSDRENILDEADAMILERRKRMAPEKVEREWFNFNPGDPMPCDPYMKIVVMLALGERLEGTAMSFQWGKNSAIRHWRPA